MSITKVLIHTDIIKPGGGPMGYSYNFLQGYQSLDAAIHARFEMNTMAHSSDQRGHSTEGNGASSTTETLKKKLRNGFPGLFMQLKYLAFLRKYKRSGQLRVLKHQDIVVFHGYQDVNALRYIHKKKISIYMPHAPTIAADEKRMNAESTGQVMTQQEYDFVKREEGYLIEKASYVVLPSKNAAEEYFKHFGKELKAKKIKYLASGVNLPAAIDRLVADPVELPANAVLFAGRYVSHKGYDLFVEVARLLQAKRKDLNFVSIGGGPLKDNSGAVTDLGWQENPFKFIQKASLILIPNKFAYYDLFPIECLALGKPLIMSEVGGNIDQLGAFPDAIGAAPTAEALAAAIERGIDQLTKDKNWGQHNREKYLSYFSATPFAKRWVDFFDEIHPFTQ